MNRAQMAISLGALLAVCIIVGILFIALALTGNSEPPEQFAIAFAGVLLILGGAAGAVRLKKLRHG